MWDRKIVLFLFIISLVLLGVSNPAFAHVLYQNPIVIEHTNILNITDATVLAGTNQITAIVTYPATSPTDTISVVLNRIGVTSNFRSEFINFTSTTTSAPSGKLHVAVGTNIVKVTYGNTQWTADVTAKTATLDPTSYITPAFAPTVLSLGRSTGCSTYGGDTDNDFICNSWETITGLVINYPTGNTYRLLCNANAVYSNPTGSQFLDELGSKVCPKIGEKDMYVEIDYLAGHKPDLDALKNVVKAFQNAPTNKINLHVIVDEQLSHATSVNFPGTTTTPGFLQVKAKEFGTDLERSNTNGNWNNWQITNYTAKYQVFQYFLWGHDAIVAGQPVGSKPSGTSDTANDGGVTLGSFIATVNNSRKQQEGTFMHELGHNLGLGHAGGRADTANCVPNVISVMNYEYQFGDLGSYSLDYSRSAIGKAATPTTLGNENLLSGFVMDVTNSDPSGQTMVYGNGAGTLSQTLPELPPEGHIWPSPWQSIRTVTDSLGHTVCPAPSTAIELKGSNQWQLVTFNRSYSSSYWALGASTTSVTIPTGNSSPGCETSETCYLPASSTINVGDTVAWENTDTTAHTVTSSDPSGTFDSGLMKSGAFFEYTFDKTGVYDYFCAVHPWMTGSILVSTGIPSPPSPPVHTDLTMDQVRAAQSINVDNIIAEINSSSDKDFTNPDSKDKLIMAAENIRTLIFGDQIYETINNYVTFKNLIDTQIQNENTKANLKNIVDVNVYRLNSVGDEPVPPCVDTDQDQICPHDECDNTPAGETVNAKGCSESQIDTDGDGVPNTIDHCANTPLGTQVGTDGCELPSWWENMPWWEHIILIIIIITIILAIVYAKPELLGLKRLAA